MRFNFTVIGLLLWSAGTFAQNMFSMSSQHPADTLRSETHQQAIRYPSLRQASVAVDFFGPGHFNSKLNDKDFASGKTRNARINSYFAVPVRKWNGNVVGVSVYHTEQFFDIRQADNHLDDPMVTAGRRSESSLGLSLNYSRTDAIFHIPVIYSAVFTGISDNLSTIKRFNFNGSIAFPLKRTPDTYLSVGVLVLVDPSAPVPIIPVVNYFRKLSGKGLQLIVDFPQGASLRQSLSRNAWVYLGANANTYVSFYKSGNSALPDRFSYNTIELKSGPGFEYLLGKYVVLTINGGVNNILVASAIGKGDNYRDAVIKTTNKSTLYGEFRVSLLPF